MIFAIELSICLMAIALTVSSMTTIHWREIRNDGGVALYIWLMMVFFTITSIFNVNKFCDFFDAYTLNNLDRLIAYCSILTGMTFGTIASIEAVGQVQDLLLRRMLWTTLVAAITALALIYFLSISRLPNISYFVPRSVPEVLFMLIMFSLGIFLSATVARVYLTYLPSETAPIMRTRSILIVAGTLVACAYFITKIIIAGGYFLPALAPQVLIDLSWVFLVTTALLHFSALLGNKIYAPVVMISRNIKRWGAFQDLSYLQARLLSLCPEVPLTTAQPSFLRFMLNPEYHLYRTVITIMDSKTLLNDLLSEGAHHGEAALWEGDTLREVVRVKRVLQLIKPSDDFWKIVDEYRHAGRRLFRSHHQALSGDIRQ